MSANTFNPSVFVPAINNVLESSGYREVLARPGLWQRVREEDMTLDEAVVSPYEETVTLFSSTMGKTVLTFGTVLAKAQRGDTL